ncbi:MAG: hypothetical protein M0P64_03315 [Candidatus Pacebacteria bacterium]|jgi:hypothetical protein|nr:hypothetical protein [Candidatus Paceibacterota bacterium]
MGKGSNAGKKKVLVLGFPVDRQAELEFALSEELKDTCSVVFTATPEEAIMKVAGSDVVAANVDTCGDFFEKLFSRGYEGHVVPMTSRRAQMTKAVTSTGRKAVYPTTFRGAADEIITALSKVNPRSSEDLAIA